VGGPWRRDAPPRRRRLTQMSPSFANFRDEARGRSFLLLYENACFRDKGYRRPSSRRRLFCATIADAILGKGDRLSNGPAKVRPRLASATPWDRVPWAGRKCASRMTLPPLSEISAMVGATRLEAGGVGDAGHLPSARLRSTRSSTRLALYVDVIEGAELFGHRRTLVPGAAQRESGALQKPGSMFC